MRDAGDSSVGTITVHKDSATEFLKLASSGDVRRAFDSYIGKNFRHHNPYFRGDAESLYDGMKANAEQNPGKRLTIERTIEEGDLVAVHSRVRLNADAPEYALAHIFRFEGDRVVELWDISQEVPTKSQNQYGMF